MKLIKVGAAVLNQTPRDWAGNLSNIIEAIKQAKQAKVSVLCLPEACVTGYGLEDDLFCADVASRAMRKLKEIAEHTEDIIVCVGLPVRFDNSLYAAVATIADGQVVGFTCKQHLAGDGIHYEPRHYKPWPSGVVQTIEVPELEYETVDRNCKRNVIREFPIGDTHFVFDGVKIGYEICEDAWVAKRPGTILASKGVDIYLNPSASHFAFGKITTRRNFVVDGSRAFGATYVYSNLVGNESGRAIFDGGALIASGGTLLAQGKRFTYQNVLLTTAIVDVHTTKTSQCRTASFQPNVEGYNDGCVKGDFEFPPVTERNVPLSQEIWETSSDVKHEECTRALGLALMDYMRKSRTHGFAVSLSGGADSAMVTYVCNAGIELGVNELGVSAFISKYCPHLGGMSVRNRNTIARSLITTAYQPTAQSGEVTRAAALALAEALGIPHYVFDVKPMLVEYKRLGKLIKGEDLNFKEDDIVLQNLQARVRAPGIWMVANYENKLLLTTSNMSEAAVGYATMDGDTAGCVSPIAGLPKVYIREYLRWVQYYGPASLDKLSAMKYINEQKPTAELRPKEFNQTDEDDLMPYWLLHVIEGYVVKNRYVPVEIYHAIKREHDYDNNRLIADITKFFRLFSRNQWKRERYALSFHMDDHNLDPRTWCRTPILTGGYEEELAELQKFII
jgi:NAD+ synthase (glutamine-hydrolysing)